MQAVRNQHGIVKKFIMIMDHDELKQHHQPLPDSFSFSAYSASAFIRGIFHMRVLTEHFEPNTLGKKKNAANPVRHGEMHIRIS